MHLTVDKLSKAYGFLWALKDVSLDFQPGQLVALLGPNGAGKTTLLRLLAGLISPPRDRSALTARIWPGNTGLRRKIGFLSPGDHLYENLTVRKISLSSRPSIAARTTPPSRNPAAVQLAARQSEYVANLSSGMKCRLSIAKWQLLQPELLLLDEPYGVLDGSGIDLLEDFLLAQCARGGIVVIASHHVARVLTLCTRAVILHQGRLTFDETKRQPWASFDQAFGEFLPHGDS